MSSRPVDETIEPASHDDEYMSRYGAFHLVDGATIIYDVENSDAWIQSTGGRAIVDME